MKYGRKVQLERSLADLAAEFKEIVNRKPWPQISELEFKQDEKDKLAPGPWKSEPDKIVWRYKDVDCMIVRNRVGALCGYAAVYSDHPLFNKDYNDEEVRSIQVHGGLTYAGHCQGPICHKSDRGEAYWFGFDCAHAEDLCPSSAMFEIHEAAQAGMKLKNPDWKHGRQDTYKDIYYVRRQVEKLATQLKELGRKH